MKKVKNYRGKENENKEKGMHQTMHPLLLNMWEFTSGTQHRFYRQLPGTPPE